jgi:hypothetical protein
MAMVQSVSSQITSELFLFVYPVHQSPEKLDFFKLLSRMRFSSEHNVDRQGVR